MMDIVGVVLVLAVLFGISGAKAFTFSHSAPVECKNVTVRWEGGTPPFYATIVPSFGVSGARIQNVSVPTSASTESIRSFSFPVNQPPGSEFSLIMSDATGWGTGGVTPVLSAAASGDASCHSTPPQAGFYFYWDPILSLTQPQCQTLRISWDAGRTYPLQLLGFIPGGSAFTIPVPQSNADRSISWPVRVREGASYQLLMADGATGGIGGNLPNTGGATNLTRVVSGPAACLQANSPSEGSDMVTIITSGGMSGSQTSMGSVTSRAPSASVSRGDGGSGGSNGETSVGGGTNIGAIVGGVVGGLAAIALLVIVLLCCRRRRRREARAAGETSRDGGEGEDDFPVKTHHSHPNLHDYGKSESTTMIHTSMAATPAALLRSATKTLKRSSTRPIPRSASRQSFDILSDSGEGVASGMAYSPGSNGERRGDDTPVSLDTIDIDPFVSPFPAPPPRRSFDRLSMDRAGSAAVPWGAAREPGNRLSGSYMSEKSVSRTNLAVYPAIQVPDGAGRPCSTGGQATEDARSIMADQGDQVPPPPPPPPPISTNVNQESPSTASRKLANSYTETPPTSPTVRTRSYASFRQSPGSPAVALPSRGSMRWSVDDDLDVGTGNGDDVDLGQAGQYGSTASRRAGTRRLGHGRHFSLGTMGSGGQQDEGRGATVIQHEDAGPGNTSRDHDLPPSYSQLRARNPDSDQDS